METSDLTGDEYRQHLREVLDGHSVDDEPIDAGDTPQAVGPAESYELYVTTPSGARLPVLTQDEVDYYEDRSRRYQKDHKFTSVTDLQDLDRILSTELMLYRYDIWMTLGQDYFGGAISENNFLKYNKDLHSTLKELKRSMGLDKTTRDKDQGADFVEWLDNIRSRAKQFMVMRNEQFFTTITLMHELIAKLQLYYNTDEIEKEELGMSSDKVIDWIWEDLKPRFEQIDEDFRRKGPDAQTYWVGDL